MEITTKFDIGDRVWYMANNIPIKGKIAATDVRMVKGKFIIFYGIVENDTIFGGGLYEKCMYSFFEKDQPLNCVFPQVRSECQVFKTKEDLKDFLFPKEMMPGF